MSLLQMPLNRYADDCYNFVSNQSKQIGSPFPNVNFNLSFTATVPTASGNQSAFLQYVKNSKRVTPGGNYTAVYAYTLNDGLSYTYLYLAFKPINNKLFLWKYPHADSGVGVLGNNLAKFIVFAEPQVQLAYYRLFKRIDTATISANAAAPNTDELFEVDFKSTCVAVSGSLQNPPVQSAFNNVICFSQGPAVWDTATAYFTEGSGTPNNSAQTRRLVKGVDYYEGYQFVLATKHTRKHIVGAMVFDDTLRGTVSYSYNAIGGDFGITEQHINALNSVVREPADMNFETAIRDALPATLVINTWPAEVPSTLTTAVTAHAQAVGFNVLPYSYTL